jgi:putative membrane protein
MSVIHWLMPYEFSPAITVTCVGALVLYLRGWLLLRRRGIAPAWPRHLAYLLGLALVYVVLQTRFDYLSQHMFFIHRIQHLVLHHLGPFLIILAAPGVVLAESLPPSWRSWLRTTRVLAPLRVAYAVVQQPVIAAVLFVALIYLWLQPTIHFYAMINVPLYDLMNWGMAIDGLLFWYLILGSRAPAEGGLGHGWRLLILGAIIIPQDIVGAYISLCGHDIYKIYAICGRVWPISALVDQQIGGLVTWVPSAMMSLFGAMVILRRWMHGDERRAVLKRESATYA